MTVLVTQAERDLARLDLELADRLGEPRDPAIVAIAEAQPANPPPPALDVAFETALEVARRAGLMGEVTERSVRGISDRAALRQVLAEHTDAVGRTVLADLTLAKIAHGVVEARAAEKAGLLARYVGDDRGSAPSAGVVAKVRWHEGKATLELSSPLDLGSALLEISESETEARGPAR